MTEQPPPACFTVHGLEHLRAALLAGADSGRAIVALSAAGASGYAGAGWFAALAAQGRAEFPKVAMTAILDCADRGGDVLAALKLGLSPLIFTGHPQATARLDSIASLTGATILKSRPASCDLLNASDPYYRSRVHCETLKL